MDLVDAGLRRPHPMTQWLRDRPLVADALLAAGLCALAVGLAYNAEPTGSERAMGLFGWTLVVAMWIPLVWRRRHPVAVLWSTQVLLHIFWVADFPDAPSGANLMIALYSLGAYQNRPRSFRHFLGSFTVAVAIMVIGVISAGEDLPAISIPLSVVTMVTAWVMGDSVNTRRRYLAELEDKAARTEAQRQAEAQRAVGQERTRIAREMHDVVAHSVSVMVVQAGAARRVVHDNPDRAADALGAIESTGRESLAEMRRILGVLRDDTIPPVSPGEDASDLAPAPSLDRLDHLVAQCADADLPVILQIDGEVRRLEPGLELSAYRVVQESLTNTLKHAGAAAARVNLHYGPDALTVEVTDDGRGLAAAALDGGGDGQGLIGMRERVEAFRGELRTGPRPGGGYQVTACFPTATSEPAGVEVAPGSVAPAATREP